MIIVRSCDVQFNRQLSLLDRLVSPITQLRILISRSSMEGSIGNQKLSITEDSTPDGTNHSYLISEHPRSFACRFGTEIGGHQTTWLEQDV